MTAECQDCRNRFFVAGAGTDSVACPDCNGQLIPERDQPGGTNSDGDLRNMVDPYTQKDMGGDPNQDGIWAKTDNGWKPPSKRDESFASVKTAAHHIENVVPGPAGIHNGVLGMLNSLASIQVNGEHVNPGSSGEMFGRYGMRNSPEFGQPVTVSAHHPAFAEFAAKIIRDSHGNRAAYKDDVMGLQQGIKAGQIPPPVDPVTKQPNLAHVNPIKFRNSHLQPLNQEIYTPWGIQRKADIAGDAWQWTKDNFNRVPSLNSLPGVDEAGDAVAPYVDAAGAVGAGALAGGGAAVAAGAGAIKRVAPTLLKGVVKAAPGVAGRAALVKALSGGGGGQDAPVAPVEAPTLQQVTHVHSFDTTPTSLDKIPESDDTGDTHEFKDQSDDLNPDNPGNDESLGANLTPETTALFNQLLPKLLDYYDSHESGLGDPEIAKLVEKLEQEDPGFMDRPDENFEDDKQNDDPLADGNVDDTDDIKSTARVAEYQAWTPGPELLEPQTHPATCPSCGWYGPMAGVCPRCGHEVAPLRFDHTENPNAGYGRAGAASWSTPGGWAKGPFVPASNPQPVPYGQSAQMPSAALPPIAPAPVGPNPQQSRCPVCGSGLNPDGTCAQCGFNPQDPNAMNRAITPGVTSGLRDWWNGGDANNPEKQICRACASPGAFPGMPCPQCGYYNQTPAPGQEMAADEHADSWWQYHRDKRLLSKTADTQGPANPEQFRAVSEVLIQQGRAEEIPHMFEAPWEYADILAQIQNDPVPSPPSVQQPAQPPMDPNAMMQGPPPGAPPQDPSAPPGGGMPPGLASISSAVSRFSADNIAPACPECGSHTTGIVSADGICHCHSCRNQWDANIEHGRLRTADYVDEQAVGEAPDKAHNHDALEDHQAPDEASPTWETSDGTPLEVGQEYELHSSKYPIPDIVKVVDVKPGEIIVSTTGEFEGLDDQITISKQEALNEDYSFVPSAGQDPEAGKENTDEYLNDEVNKQRANTDPTPTSAVPYTSSQHEATWPEHVQQNRQGIPGGKQYDSSDEYYKKPQDRKWMQQNQQRMQDSTMFDDMSSIHNVALGTQAWRPGTHGRGLIDAEGNVHTWPEEHGTHDEFMRNKGIDPRSVGYMFGIGPEGGVSDFYGKQTPEQADILRGNGLVPAQPTEEDDLWGAFSSTRPGNPRARVASDPNSIDQQAYQAIKTQGGTTIGLDGTIPTSGFAFSPFKHWEMRIPQDQFTPEHVTQYVSTHHEALEQPNNYLGAWIADGQVWLDVSQVLPDRDQALQAAAAADQDAIFDLSSFEEIPVSKPNTEGPTEPVAATASVDNSGLDWLTEGTRITASPAPWEQPLPDLTGADIFDPSKVQAEDTGPDWLLDGASIPRVAGRKFSPGEQKKFIDEDGEARNLDKLDLEGTHYRTKDSSVVNVPGRGMRMSDPYAVPDDHLVFGL